MENFLERPEATAELARDELAQLFIKLQTLNATVLARLLNVGDAAQSRSDSLDADAIAAAMGVDRRWVFRHAKDLPFVVRTGRKSLVGSRAGLIRWLKTRRK